MDDLNSPLNCIPMTLAYHHAMHAMWCIFHIYSISGFCFSSWSSQVTPSEWKRDMIDTWTWICIHITRQSKSTHVHQHFGFRSVCECILNRIFVQFNAHRRSNHKRASERARKSFIWISSAAIKSVCTNAPYKHSIQCEVSWNFPFG